MESLFKRYYDVNDSLYLGSYNRIKNEFKHLKKSEILNFLMGQTPYTLFKPVRKRFLRRKMVKKHPMQCLAIDLGDLFSLKKENHGKGWLFVAKDFFSSYVILNAVESKSKEHMRECFVEMVKKTEIALS